MLFQFALSCWVTAVYIGLDDKPKTDGCTEAAYESVTSCATLMRPS